jgi:hypothetical protein
VEARAIGLAIFDVAVLNREYPRTSAASACSTKLSKEKRVNKKGKTRLMRKFATRRLVRARLLHIHLLDIGSAKWAVTGATPQHSLAWHCNFAEL